MPMKRSYKRMRDFMQDCVTDMRLFGMPHKMARQRNSAIGIVALAGTPTCMIKPHMPSFQPVLGHQHSRHVQRMLQRPGRSRRYFVFAGFEVTRLHDLQAIR